MAVVVSIGNGVTSGHGGFPPTTPSGCSSDVFVEGSGIIREGDAWVTHCDPYSCHVGITLAHSPDVFANGLPIARVGGKLSCGDTIVSGATTVSN